MEKNKTCNRPGRYSLAMFGLSIAGYMYVTYGTFFYTETIGLSMKLIALGNVLYAVWDAFNDPIAGYLSDRTRTRWGLSGALILYSILGCRERSEFSQSEQPGLLASLKALATNANFWLVSVSHFFYQSTSGLLLAGIPFYIKYALQLPDSNATFLSAAVFVSAIPSMYLWYRLINRLGTLKCWRIALAWLGLSLVPMYFVHSLLPACLAGVLVGVGIAGVTANLDMVNSVLIEDDAARYGVRREATFFAGISFITRLSSLTRSGVFLLLFTLFGFESGENPGAMPGTAARFMMIVFPIALMAFSVCASLLVRFRAPAARAAKPAAKL